MSTMQKPLSIPPEDRIVDAAIPSQITRLLAIIVPPIRHAIPTAHRTYAQAAIYRLTRIAEEAALTDFTNEISFFSAFFVEL